MTLSNVKLNLMNKTIVKVKTPEGNIMSKKPSNNDPVKKPSCPECGSYDLATDHMRGESTCMNCGVVVESNLVTDSPEWRAFNSEERNARSRVGGPSTFTVHDKGLSTQIGWEDRDTYGNRLSPSQRSQMYRLRKWQIRSMVHSSADRNLAYALSELDRIASQLGLPRSVKETASVIYRSAVENNLVRGRSIEGMIAASAYAAARMRRVPRTLDEFARHSRITSKEIGRSYRLLINNLNYKVPLANPADYIVRFAAELRFRGQTARDAIDLIKDAKAKGITAGKDPTGLAAAALYICGIMSGERRTQREIANVATVTEVTVRNRYKELVRELGIRSAA
jgi:transcription initiation factor TFIIB